MIEIILYGKRKGCAPCDEIKKVWEDVLKICEKNEELKFTSYMFEDSQEPFRKYKIRSAPLVAIHFGENEDIDSNFTRIVLSKETANTLFDIFLNSGVCEAMNYIRLLCVKSLA